MANIIAPLQLANHGRHFRACALRGSALLIDPFIGVDHAWMSGPTFAPHPHAGFCAVSYVFLDSETGLDNRDSLGSHNLIRPGGVHWATAGSGIVHEEVPAETGKTVHSLQIFVDLARDRKGIAPSASSLEPEDVPVVQLPGARVRVPVGSFGNVRSPLHPATEVSILDISLEEGAELTLSLPSGDSAFVMPIYGTTSVDGQHFELNSLRLPVFPAANVSHAISLRASSGSAKVMFFAGPPLHSSTT